MYPELLVADKKGRIYNVPGVQAAAMKAGRFFSLPPKDLLKLPPASELFMLPQRPAVGYVAREKRFVAFSRNPAAKGKEACCAVAAFVPPGFTLSYNTAFCESSRAQPLPLFAYAPVCWYKGAFYVSALHVDKARRHDVRFMDIGKVVKNARAFKKAFPRNRLIAHLEQCACRYGCPNAKNFFLRRFEAPLPTSPSCNARCAGCISYQESARICASQPRITFVPRAEEVAEVALVHLERVADPIVSFGQGCEGEPLLQWRLLEKAIRAIRKKTSKGVINLNTNASMPHALARLCAAGLDAVRVSINSAREQYYRRYYKPQGYTFKDVCESMSTIARHKVFLSLNYLTMPGFTDSRAEQDALKKLIEHHHVDMIQWRNLNYDPLAYFRELKVSVSISEMYGMREAISSLRARFPGLLMGYFNPVRARLIRRA